MSGKSNKSGIHQESMSTGNRPSKSKKDEIVELDIDTSSVSPSRKRTKKEEMRKMKKKEGNGGK